MEQKIIQIGNSTGIIIPKQLLNQLGLQEGSWVLIEADSTSEALVVIKKGSKKKATSITPQYLAILEKVNKLYGSALKELAQA